MNSQSQSENQNSDMIHSQKTLFEKYSRQTKYQSKSTTVGRQPVKSTNGQEQDNLSSKDPENNQDIIRQNALRLSKKRQDHLQKAQALRSTLKKTVNQIQSTVVQTSDGTAQRNHHHSISAVDTHQGTVNNVAISSTNNDVVSGYHRHQQQKQQNEQQNQQEMLQQQRKHFSNQFMTDDPQIHKLYVQAYQNQQKHNYNTTNIQRQQFHQNIVHQQQYHQPQYFQSQPQHQINSSNLRHTIGSAQEQQHQQNYRQSAVQFNARSTLPANMNVHQQVRVNSQEHLRQPQLHPQYHQQHFIQHHQHQQHHHQPYPQPQPQHPLRGSNVIFQRSSSPPLQAQYDDRRLSNISLNHQSVQPLGAASPHPFNNVIHHQHSNNHMGTISAAQHQHSNRSYSSSQGKLKTNVIFNYRSNEQPQPQPRVSYHHPAPPTSMEQLPFFPPSQLSGRQQSVSPPSNRRNSNVIFHHHSSQPHSQPISQQPQWKQKYFALKHRFEQVYSKLNHLIQEFEQYSQMATSIITTSTTITTTITEFTSYTQQITTLFNDLRYDSNQALNQQNQSQMQKSGPGSNAAHIEAKYNRLLVTHRQLEEQNKNIKFSFESRINNIVKRLEDDNSMLKGRIEELLEQNSRIEKALQFKQQEIYQLRQSSTVMNPNIRPSSTGSELSQLNERLLSLSNELSSSIGQRNQLAARLQQHRVKVSIFQAQIQRLTQNTNQLSTSLRQKQTEIHSLKVSLESSSQNQKFVEYYKIAQQAHQEIQKLEKKSQSLHFQNTTLKDEIERLNAKVSQLQGLLNNQKTSENIQIAGSSQLKSQYELTISLLRSELQRKQDEIDREIKISEQRILDLTEQLKIGYSERENLHKRHQEKIRIIQKERDTKQSLVRQLRDKNYEFEQQIRRLEQSSQSKNEYTSQMNKIQQQEEIYRLKNQLEQVRRQKERDAKTNQQALKVIEEHVVQLKIDNTRLKKQISEFGDLSNEIEMLHVQLQKKNAQIIQLRDNTFENQKWHVQSGNLKKQNDILSEEVKRLTSDAENFNRQMLDQNRFVKQYQANMSSLNLKIVSIQSQYNLVKEANDRKDHEISKLRQANQLLEVNSHEIQREVQRLRQKLRDQENVYQRQKQSYLNQIRSVESKYNDMERLIREKSVSEHRLQELQTALSAARYQINEFEESTRTLKNKNKKIQSDNEDLALDKQELIKKIEEMDKNHSQSIKKYKKITEQLEETIKQIKEKQAGIQKQKMAALAHDLKAKQNKIWKLQKELEEIQERLDEVGDQQIDQHKIMHLEQKVKEYESRLFNQTFKSSIGSYDYQATQVFQRKIIYELKEQNQRLREFISQKRIDNKSRSIKLKPTSDRDQSYPEAQMKQAYDEDMDQVQERLLAFNARLQALIKTGSYDQIDLHSNTNNQKSTPHLKSRNPSKSPSRLKQNTQFSKISFTNLQNFDQNSAAQVRQLKMNYSQLQRYCKNIEAELLSGGTKNGGLYSQIMTFNQKGFKSNQHDSIQNNTIQFHKQKNNELQERNEKLLAMNKELKSTLENLIQKGNNDSSISYYKQQIIELTQTISQLEGKIRRLADENKLMKSSTAAGGKTDQRSTFKIMELEKKIMELQRLNNETVISRTSLERDRDELKADVEKYHREITDLRNQLDYQKQHNRTGSTANREKIDSLEMEISKLISKLRINQSQIERLNQTLKKKNLQANEEVNKWKLKVTQLTQQIDSIGSSSDREKQNQASLRTQINRLTQELRSCEYELTQFKKSQQHQQRRLRDTENKNRDLIHENQNLQNELMQIRGNQSEWTVTIENYETQLAKLKNQIVILQSEIQRVADSSQSKIRNYQEQISSLQNKLALAQRERSNLKKSTVGFESIQQNYENDIMKFKNQIAFLHAQIERMTAQFGKQRRIYEEKLATYKNQLAQLEGNTVSLNQNIELQAEKKRLQQQITRLHKQINVIQVENQRLNSRIRELERSASNSSELESYKARFISLSMISQRVNYLNELHRSIFLEVEALLDEQTIRSQSDMVAVKMRAFEQINKGLQACNQFARVNAQFVEILN